jgi:hypothetical protein
MIKRLTVNLFFLLGLMAGCSGKGTEYPPSENAVIPTVPTPSYQATFAVPTNVPILPDGDANKALKVFIQTNGECRLPCVLGLTPGLTDQVTAESFIGYFANLSGNLSQLSDNLEIYANTGYSDRGGVIFTLWENDKYVVFGLGYSLNQGKIAHIDVFGEALQKGDDWAQKLFGDPLFDDVLSSFTVTNILRTYGPPQQIWVMPFPDDPEYPTPPLYTFNFILVYPDDGFLVEYRTERTQQDDYYVGCPTKAYSLAISAWDPKSPITLMEAVQGFSSVNGASIYNINRFRPIDDVTSFNIANFYSTFVAPDSDECVQSFQRLWATPTP